MRGGSEPEQAQPLSRLDPAEHQRSVPDDAAAQKRRRLLVGERVGEGEHEVAAGRHPFGVPAVHRPAGELGLLAQILEPGSAVVACAVRASQPRQPHTFAGGEAPDRLVAGNQRRAAHRQVSPHDLQVGAAHGAHRHVDHHLAVRGDRVGDRPQRQVAGLCEHHCAHLRLIGYHADSGSAQVDCPLKRWSLQTWMPPSRPQQASPPESRVPGTARGEGVVEPPIRPAGPTRGHGHACPR